MKRRFTSLQIVIHLGAWIPLILLVFDLLAGRLSVNPIQDVEQRTGRAAITLLVLSLACTPLNTLFGWREVLKRRRALGLYAFMYAAIHMLVFVGLDYALSWPLIRDAILEKRYILVGALSFLMLLPLAITSFKYWMKRFGRNWARLHRLIYLVAPLVVLHYTWAKKGDLFHLRGDILRPLVYGLIVILLLLFRLPPVRRALSSVRTRVQVLGRKALSIFKKSGRFDGLNDDMPRYPLALISIERHERQVKAAGNGDIGRVRAAQTELRSKFGGFTQERVVHLHQAQTGQLFEFLDGFQRQRGVPAAAADGSGNFGQQKSGGKELCTFGALGSHPRFHRFVKNILRHKPRHPDTGIHHDEVSSLSRSQGHRRPSDTACAAETPLGQRAPISAAR